METVRPLLALASLLLISACDDGASAPEAAPAEPKAVAPAEAEPEVDAVAKAAAPAEAESGAEAPDEAEPEVEPEPPAEDVPAAYLEIDGKGWFVITDEATVALPGDEVMLRGEPRVHDGKGYGLTYSGVVEFNPSGAVPVEGGGVSDISVRDFAVAPDGSFWTLAPGKLAHLVEGSWADVAFDVELPSDALYTGLAIDADGEPWVATGKAIYRRKDDAWVQAEFPGSKKAIFLQGLASSPTGEVYLPHRDRVYQLGDTATKIKARPPGYGSWATIRFATGEDDAVFAVAEASTGAVMFAPESRKVHSKRDLDIGYVSAVAVDGQGRMWLGGASGIVVSVAKGDDRVYPSGSLEGLSGKVRRIVVTGPGPKLPETSGEIATGTLTGSVYLDDEKFANTKVEICPSPNTFFTRTPCAGEKPRFTAKTDPEGNFTIADVPLGSYGVAVKVKGRSWQMTLFGDLGTQMKAGETYDVGDIRLETKKK